MFIKLPLVVTVQLASNTSNHQVQAKACIAQREHRQQQDHNKSQQNPTKKTWRNITNQKV